MATGQGQRLAWQLDGLLIGGTAAGLTDGQLLERFATASGPVAESAFAAIVERHGPMVLRVCLGVAGNRHDAEDAFQATFLVLVNKGRSLWVADSLGPWLHQVALRTSHGARAAASRRRRHEEAVALRTEEADDGEEDRDELSRILHEEIGRLPDHYRVPVVLCDLEGQTQEQAARSAGLPLGTVKSRLNRAREKLRNRLARRGLSPSAGVVIPAIPPIIDGPVPVALIQSTAAAALRAVSLRTLAGTTAGILAQGVISAMARSFWWKAATVLLVSAATISGAGLASGQATLKAPPAEGSRQDAGDHVGTVKVEPGSFRLLVSGNGTLETERTDRVVAEVDSNTAIVSTIPDGSRVKKGDLVIELDSTSARKSLSRQQLATQAAESRLKLARLARETAEAAVKVYEQATYRRDKFTILGDIKLAEAELTKAEARLERTRKARERLREIQGRQDQAANAGQIMADLDIEDRVDRAEQDTLSGKLNVEASQNRLNTLEKFSRPMTLKELSLKVEEARTAEDSRIGDLEREKAMLAHLESQVRACKILTPRDGIIAYSWAEEGSSSREGTVVIPRQHLFTLLDVSGPMLFAAALGEGMIHRVTEGQKVDVRIDAFEAKRFTGVVTKVPHGPDPRRLGSGFKVYTTMVRLDGVDGSLRPGMNGHAEILVAQHDNALTVPAKAVIGREKPYRLAINKPDGQLEIREVTLGDADESRVEVKTGLRPGEEVVLQPESLLSDSKRPERDSSRAK